MITSAFSAPPTYSIRTRFFLVRDGTNELEHRVDFHVKTGDCFPMLATAIGLLEDSLGDAAQKAEAPHGYHLMLLRELKEDLLYLGEKYQIVPKKDRI